jgi:hypothetical protein
MTEFADAKKLRAQIPAELARQRSAGGELASRHYLAWFVYGGVVHVGSAPEVSN